MGLEAATYLNDLNSANPVGGDPKSEGDNHMRMVKAVLQATFPGLAGVVWRHQTKGAGYTVIGTDNMTIFNCTAALTLSMTAAATLGNGHFIFVYANGFDVVVDPNGAETINGASTLTVPAGNGAIVLCNGASFVAFVLPTAAAITVQPWTTGDVKLTVKTAADSGWVMMNDGSIGDATSGGTTRANADTSALFTLIWNNVSNTWAATQDSAGSPVARGASAAADFAAHRRIVLPKTLGRALAISGAGSGLTSRALGEVLGEETHVLSTAEMPSHDHNLQFGDDAGGLAAYPGANSIGTAASNGGSLSMRGDIGGGIDPIQSTGGGGAHNNMQPSSFLNIMIKL